MCMPQETRISLCINMSPNSTCVWAKGHKGFLGKYYILYNKCQWLLCSPPAGGWRQPSVHTGFIAWNLLAPGATFIWLYPRAELQPPRQSELAGTPRGWHFLGRSSAQPEPRGLSEAWGSCSSSPLAAPQPCLQESSATSLPGWTSVPSPLSFSPAYSGEKHPTWAKRSALRHKPRCPFENWIF